MATIFPTRTSGNISAHGSGHKCSRVKISKNCGYKHNETTHVVKTFIYVLDAADLTRSVYFHLLFHCRYFPYLVYSSSLNLIAV